MIEVSVAYGEHKRLILPDSSEVWLNAGSTILYPETFAKDKRLVILNGEAYFSVQKDTASPFIVEVPQLSVKVLGTKFNVKAYPGDEKITTTLTSGKVEVSVQSQPPRILKPNEQLTYDKKSSDIHISVIDTHDTNSWVVGKLIFTNTTPEKYSEVPKDIDGNWQLVSVLRNGTDITDYMDFKRFHVLLNKDNTYKLNNYLPFIVKNDGTWNVDDPIYPFHLILKEEGSEKEVKTEIGFLTVDGNADLP